MLYFIAAAISFTLAICFKNALRDKKTIANELSIYKAKVTRLITDLEGVQKEERLLSERNKQLEQAVNLLSKENKDLISAIDSNSLLLQIKMEQNHHMQKKHSKEVKDLVTKIRKLEQQLPLTTIANLEKKMTMIKPNSKKTTNKK